MKKNVVNFENLLLQTTKQLHVSTTYAFILWIFAAIALLRQFYLLPIGLMRKYILELPSILVPI